MLQHHQHLFYGGHSQRLPAHHDPKPKTMAARNKKIWNQELGEGKGDWNREETVSWEFPQRTRLHFVLPERSDSEHDWTFHHIGIWEQSRESDLCVSVYSESENWRNGIQFGQESQNHLDIQKAIVRFKGFLWPLVKIDSQIEILFGSDFLSEKNPIGFPVHSSCVQNRGILLRKQKHGNI